MLCGLYLQKDSFVEVDIRRIGVFEKKRFVRCMMN